MLIPPRPPEEPVAPLPERSRVARWRANEGQRVAAAAVALASAKDMSTLVDRICEQACTLLGAGWSSVTIQADLGATPIHASQGEQNLEAPHPSLRRVLGVDQRDLGTLRLGHGGEGLMVSDAILTSFAEMCGLAVERLLDGELLRYRAAAGGRDGLSGLVDARGLRERLTDEVERASRRGRNLALSLISVDHSQQIEQVHGGQVCERILVEVGRQVRSACRSADTVAHLGPGLLALLLPEATREDALRITESLRAALSSRALLTTGTVTVSCGVATLRDGAEAPNLYLAAERARQWAIELGGDRCEASDGLGDVSTDQRDLAEATAALETIAGLVDAKDPLTRDRSDRVAAIAGEIALELGWGPSRVERLMLAARLHDVGLLVVPGGLLRKTGRFTRAEREQLRQHATLGAEIVANTLDDDQVRWIRTHHERPDGLGYPHGLRSDAIPAEASVIGLAATWNALTSPRRHRPAMNARDAVATVSEARGGEFAEAPVAALVGLVRRGSPAVASR